MGEKLHLLEGSDQSPHVYVIDDDIGVRQSLHFLLSSAGFTSWSFASAIDFLDNLPTIQPAPILLDVRMPEIDGIELMNELVKRSIKWPVIVITAHADIPIAVQAIKLGAIDFLEKPFDFELLKTSLGVAIENLSKINFASEAQTNARRLFASLTPREFEVLISLTGGCSNKAVAHTLSVSVRTIEMHRANALLKLKVRSIPEVVHLARNAGIQL